MTEIDSMNFPQSDEVLVQGDLMKTHDSKTEKMYVEDLAALERLSDEKILEELKARYALKKYYTFVGNVLLFINPNNKTPPIFDRKV